MTKVTTITEYKTANGKVVNGSNTDGISGHLVYANDEATITMIGCENEVDQFSVHPQDALIEFLSNFFELN